MNLVEGGLFSFLKNSPTIAAYVVGSNGVPRIYPLALRQDKLQLPALSYHTVAGESGLAISGQGTKKGYRRLQISVWSFTRNEAETIVEALRVLLNGYIGQWDDLYVSVVSFTHAPPIFDHIAKVTHVPCQIAVYHDEP